VHPAAHAEEQDDVDAGGRAEQQQEQPDQRRLPELVPERPEVALHQTSLPGGAKAEAHSVQRRAGRADGDDRQARHKIDHIQNDKVGDPAHDLHEFGIQRKETTHRIYSFFVCHQYSKVHG